MLSTAGKVLISVGYLLNYSCRLGEGITVFGNKRRAWSYLKALTVSGLLGLAATTPTAAGTITFDQLATGTIVDTLQGVSFDSNIGVDLIATTGFSTTSGVNYLGVDDGGFEVFLPGDVIELSFAQAVRTLSVNFISTPNTPANVFGIQTQLGNVLNTSVPTTILPDGGEVFFVFIAEPIPFSTATLTTASSGVFSFNVDDIAFAVDEPATITLFLSMLLAMRAYRAVPLRPALQIFR